MKHRHEPELLQPELLLLQCGGWLTGEKCKSCEKRRTVLLAMGLRRKDIYSKWVTKEQAEDANLIWLWRDELSGKAQQK